MARFLRAAIFVVCFFSAGSAFAAGGSCPSGSTYGPQGNATLASLGVTSCYYIAANGADTNSGTSESSPWLHAPGMPNCTSNCASALGPPGNTIAGGIGIIFRGGDTWHFGNSGLSPYTGGEWLMNNWWGTDASCQYEGTASGCIYWGVDLTWYSGSSWARPIMNSDNPLSTSRVASCAYQVGSVNNVIQAGVADWIDNFEFTGFCSSRNPASSGPFTDIIVGYGGSGISGSGMLIETNLYIHGWTVTTAAGTANGTVPCDMLGGGNNGLQSIVRLVIDGSDSDPRVCAWGVFPSFYHFKDSIVRYATQGVGQWCHDIHDNVFEHMYGPDVPTHGNLLECNADANGAAINQPRNTPNVIYNNIFRHDDPSITSNPDLWVCPNTMPEYWFNNLLYDLDGEGWSIAGPAGYSGCPNSGGQYMFNNTLVDLTQPCSLNPINNGTSGRYLTVSNEHLINAPGDTYISPGCTGRTSTSNIAMSNSTATTQGYTTGSAGTAQPNTCANENTIPCAPGSSSAGTVGTGANHQAYCTTLASYASEYAIGTEAANACQYGTTDGCVYLTATHTMSCPAQSPAVRPSTGAWDVGANQFGGSSNRGNPGTQTLEPPSNLQATVH